MRKKHNDAIVSEDRQQKSGGWTCRSRCYIQGSWGMLEFLTNDRMIEWKMHECWLGTALAVLGTLDHQGERKLSWKAKLLIYKPTYVPTIPTGMRFGTEKIRSNRASQGDWEPEESCCALKLRGAIWIGLDIRSTLGSSKRCWKVLGRGKSGDLTSDKCKKRNGRMDLYISLKKNRSCFKLKKN